ncbi:MAG: hypothetical protein R3320_11610 [Nitriliruptorales bacterium]|nr:hypothetical protein [Nitriliruptorales bacterium]
MSGATIGFLATIVAAVTFFVLAVSQLRRVTGASEPIDDDADES